VTVWHAAVPLGTEAHSSAQIAGKEPQFTKIVVTVAAVQKPLICRSFRAVRGLRTHD
jgi:hypothetical protein